MDGQRDGRTDEVHVTALDSVCVCVCVCVCVAAVCDLCPSFTAVASEPGDVLAWDPHISGGGGGRFSLVC